MVDRSLLEWLGPVEGTCTAKLTAKGLEDFKRVLELHAPDALDPADIQLKIAGVVVGTILPGSIRFVYDGEEAPMMQFELLPEIPEQEKDCRP